MQAYMRHNGCLMEFLTTLLDDPSSARCGRCSNDVGSGLPRTVDPERVKAAVSFLRRDLRTIKPRLRWAADAVPDLSGKIDPPNEIGCALCVYGDAGWGRDVQRGKYVDGRFSRELVVASARAIRDRWRPQPEPEWVTGLPSSVVSGLVDGFARSLAEELRLPYVECLSVPVGAEPQTAMQNSTLQLRNASHKIGILDGPVPSGPVLLVDDIVDSGWTLTVAGALLRSHGSGPVHPFTLATASGRDSGARRVPIEFQDPSPDATAIILLCSSIGNERDPGTKPLGPRSWAKLHDELVRQSFPGPRALIGLTAEEIDRSLGVGPDEAARLARLLGRGGQLAFELDRLRSRGIWVVTIADDAYPTRLRERLGPDAPPVLFGSGSVSSWRVAGSRSSVARCRRRRGRVHTAAGRGCRAWRGEHRLGRCKGHRCDRDARRL